jgi:hypothetical protein
MALHIHPPTKPIHSVKDFLLHLFTITRGILIALGLEGVVERAHHRNLAREAKTNLVREMTDNHRGLSGGLKSMETTDAQLQSILNTVRALAADRSAKPGNLDLSVSINTPSSTAWSTAATTGALGYMERDDVERFTKVYDLQQVFMSAEQRAVESLLELESYGALAHGPLARISDAQAVEAERAAGRALAATRMAEDIGKSLEAEYRKLLAATK